MEIFSPGHLIPLLIVALVLFFGWKQLPDMARSLGRSMRVFRTEIKGLTEDDKAREAAKAEPKALENRPVEATHVESAEPKFRPVPAATVAAEPAVRAAAPSPQPVRSRPRPAPSPNGRANAS